MKFGDDSEKALVQVRAVFADHQDALGKPEAPTQAGYVALARAGKDVWNVWRAAWPEPTPTFSNVNFRKAPIDFAGFLFGNGVRFYAEFGDDACFDGAQFGDQASFYAAQFGDRASFVGAQFGDAANLIGAQFGDDACFDGAQFGFWASFDGAQFGDDACFDGAQFGDRASFDGAQFGDDARFDGAQFGFRANFNGAQFGDRASYVGAQFGGEASFDGTQFDNWAHFDGAQFGEDARFLAWDRQQVEAHWRAVCLGLTVEGRIKRAHERDLRSDALRSISFVGVQFAGDVSFQNREFLATTDFGPTNRERTVHTLDRTRVIPKGQQACFSGVPAFHGCKLHQDTSFEGAEFLAPASQEAMRAFRTLKLAMAQQQALREEQRFFRKEMETEGALAKYGRWILFWLYGKLSDYGFSLWRPLVFWSVSLGVFGIAHGALAGPSALHTGIDWQRTMQWAQYVLLNANPLPGFDKLQLELRNDLFRSSGQGAMLAAIVFDMLHKTCALIAAFLVGLALRNFFKMKG